MGPVLPPRRQTKFRQVFGALHPVRSHDYTHHRRTKPQRVLVFKNALLQHQRQLKEALSKALTWLAEDPPPFCAPPPRSQNLGQTTQHLQHVTHPTGAQRLPLSPASRPPARLTPTPPSKKPRTHKNKMPMRPKQPPTKRSRDTEDPPPRKPRSDTYAPKPVASPQPLGADSSDRRITDFVRAPAPPLPPAEPPPSVGSTPESFLPPPIACPTPPKHAVYSRPNTE